MRSRLHKLQQGRSAGAATLEYAAATALASVLAMSVLVPAAGGNFAVVVERAICQVETAAEMGGCTVPQQQQPTAPSDPSFDPKPKKCKLNEQSEKANGQIKIGFIKIGENSGFVVTTFSDGSVTYTVTDGAEIGVTGGFGGKFDVGKLERAEKIDFGANLKFDYGSTWTFKDAPEADAMKGQLDRYLRQEDQLKDGNPGMYLYYMIKGFTDPPKPPNQQVSTLEVGADVTAKVGLSLPFDTGPNAESGVPNFELADFGAKFGGSGKWTQIHDTENKSTTYTTGGEIFGQYNGTLGPYGGELKSILGTSMSITRDQDNQITKVTLVTSAEGKATGTGTVGQPKLGGQGSDSDARSLLTVTTTSLDVSTPEQRALTNAWLQSLHDNPLNYVSPKTLYPDSLDPGNPFQNLMYTNATVSNVDYDKVTDKTGFAAEVKVGVALGVDFSLEDSESKATDASYLDVPQPDGTRPPVDFPACISR